MVSGGNVCHTWVHTTGVKSQGTALSQQFVSGSFLCAAIVRSGCAVCHGKLTPSTVGVSFSN